MRSLAHPRLWRRHKNHPDFGSPPLRLGSPGAVDGLLGRDWRGRLDYRGNPSCARDGGDFRDLHGEYGLKSRINAAVGGRYLLEVPREERRLAAAGSTSRRPSTSGIGRPNNWPSATAHRRRSANP